MLEISELHTLICYGMVKAEENTNCQFSRPSKL